MMRKKCSKAESMTVSGGVKCSGNGKIRSRITTHHQVVIFKDQHRSTTQRAELAKWVVGIGFIVSLSRVSVYKQRKVRNFY
jgi:hypothetical protein